MRTKTRLLFPLLPILLALLFGEGVFAVMGVNADAPRITALHDSMDASQNGAYTPASALTSGSPVLWNTFLGSSAQDAARVIAVDDSGNIYVTGHSVDTWGSMPVQSHSGGGADAFVAKLSNAGTLLWHTFLGGSGVDYGTGLAIDGNGNIYVVGASDATA